MEPGPYGRCRLWQSRTHAVPGEGEACAQLVLIGEARRPRRDEMNTCRRAHLDRQLGATSAS